MRNDEEQFSPTSCSGWQNPVWPAVLLLAMLTFMGVLAAGAQSLNKSAAAPLQAGLNNAQVDSLIGSHYWYFWAEPGKFQVTFAQGAAVGLAASGQASIRCGFAPPTTGSHITLQNTPEGAVFSGTVTQRTRVGMAIAPPNSTLVRSTVPYQLSAAGNVVFDGVDGSVPPVVGMYTPFLPQVSGAPPLGATRFNADGTIETANGQRGSWRLFDKQSSTYTVTIAGQRLSLWFDPGRGLVDRQGGNITFARAN